MGISGLPPSGGANRIANAYGFPAKRAAAAPPVSPVTNGSQTDKTGAVSGEGFKLRSVLNDEERAYFDQLSTMGPITYGPGAGAKNGMVPDAPRGLRLDVRG